MSFHVGQKVVCVDDEDEPNRPAFTPHGRRYPPTKSWLKKGAIYTVRWSGIYQHRLQGDFYGVCLAGIDRKRPGWRDAPFKADRFRPLINRSTETGMSILRKVADDASKRRNLVVTP